MEFSHKKLPPEEASKMRVCPVHSVRPYALMLAPVYVFMKRNQKFVAVKEPLDFFTPSELQHLAPFESFFVPEFVDESLIFRQVGRQVRALIAWQDRFSPSRMELPPSPYEIEDAVLRLVGPLWTNTLTIEPFFVTVFANEICDLFPEDMLLNAREKSVETFEKALYASSWIVYLALHLGYSELKFLNQLRQNIFSEIMSGAPLSRVPNNELNELIQWAVSLFKDGHPRSFQPGAFLAQKHLVFAQKIMVRLIRIKNHLLHSEYHRATIYGAKGVVDA